MTAAIAALRKAGVDARDIQTASVDLSPQYRYGENQPPIRARIVEHLGFLGIRLDEEANAANSEVISAKDSAVKVMVIATNEERVIAEEALSLLDG